MPIHVGPLARTCTSLPRASGLPTLFIGEVSGCSFAMSVASVAPVAVRRPPDVVNRWPVLCSPHVCSPMALYELPMIHLRKPNVTTSRLALQRLTTNLTEQLTDLNSTLLAIVRRRELCCESWVSTRFKVLHRFRHHVFQRRGRRQPKQLLSFLRLEIDDKRNALRRARLSSRHVWDAELRCRINLFCASCPSGFPHEKIRTEYTTYGDLEKRKDPI